jgi:hypothetical protein
MTVKVLINEKNQRLNHPAVTINPKLRRLMLNQQAFSLLLKDHGTESQYVQILYDYADPKGIFWIKMCNPELPGSRKLDTTSKSTRTCNISSLLQVLNLNSTETTRFEMTYDKQLKAGKVNTGKPLGLEVSDSNEKIK